MVSAVLMSGLWQPEAKPLAMYGIELEWRNIARDVILLAIAGLSLKLTSRECREKNGFSWRPLRKWQSSFLASSSA